MRGLAASLVRLSWLRTGLGVLLALGLFSATLHNEQAYVALGTFWQQSLTLLEGDSRLALLPHDPSLTQVMHRPRNGIVVLAYGILYVGGCLALLFLLLPLPQQRRLVLLFYGLASGAVLLLLLAARLSGLEALTVLNSNLVHFVVSPLPVILLVPILRWYVPFPVARKI